MEKFGNDLIKHLTENDTKTLSQKALKTAEEVGELAKSVLPYENAAGTTHRFVEKTKILEECADIFLCIKSIAYDLGYDDQEFDDMINHKLKYWADLQARERQLNYPIPYEMHITVDPNGDLQNFKKACEFAGVKPILLDLHLKDDAVIKDMMTSSVFMGNNKEAYLEIENIAANLEIFGCKILRKKIETIPWHPAAPSMKHENPKMPPNCYFECHLNVLSNKTREDSLHIIAAENGAHKSSNVFKKYDDDNFTTMLTLRTYTGFYEDFKQQVENLKNHLEEKDFQIEKEIIEFSIYDTKVSHDASWIKQ